MLKRKWTKFDIVSDWYSTPNILNRISLFHANTEIFSHPKTSIHSIYNYPSPAPHLFGRLEQCSNRTYITSINGTEVISLQIAKNTIPYRSSNVYWFTFTLIITIFFSLHSCSMWLLNCYYCLFSECKRRNSEVWLGNLYGAEMEQDGLLNQFRGVDVWTSSKLWLIGQTHFETSRR